MLKESLVKDNVEIITTTETTVNDIKTVSVQQDIYYGNKYYHSSENTSTSTKTWYGTVNNILYAFYYTKNANNDEVKTSSRIEDAQLESVMKQPNSIYHSIVDSEGNLLNQFDVSASKSGNTYTIQVSSFSENESISYIFTVTDSKIIKIVQSSSINNDIITITYDYNYDVSDIELPSLSEYSLNVNG